MKISRFLCAAIALSLTLAACSTRAFANAQTLTQASASPVQPTSTSNPTNTANGTTASSGSATKVASPAPGAGISNNTQANGMQAALTSLGGTVEVKRAPESEFNTISDTTAVVGGDTIRTGPKSVALLILMDNTELTIYENSEVTINRFARQSAGGVLIKLNQVAGFVFQRINFGSLNPGSSYELTTPHAVTTVHGTAYWAKVLPDKDIFYCVVGHVDVQPKGKTAVVGCEGITVEVKDSAVTKSILDPTLFHGDGICDPYMGEDSITSAQDCRNGNSTIHCGNKVCEPSVGENADTCPIDCKP